MSEKIIHIVLIIPQKFLRVFLKQNKHQKMKIRLLSLLVLISSLSYSKDIEIQQYTLKNGFTVILNEDHTKPEVFGYMVCKTGGKDDPSDATGMAHYMEHMFYHGI